MIRRLLHLAVFSVYAFLSGSPAIASDVCGSAAPDIPTTSQDEHRSKQELDGKINALSALIGKGGFKAQSDIYRRQIMQDPDKLRASFEDQRFFYAVCGMIEEDPTLSTPQKIALIMHLKQPIPTITTNKTATSRNNGNQEVNKPDLHGEVDASAFRFFDLNQDGYKILSHDQIQININGFAHSPSHSSSGANVVINGEVFPMFAGDTRDIQISRGVCKLQLVEVNSIAISKFRSNCGVN